MAKINSSGNIYVAGVVYHDEIPLPVIMSLTYWGKYNVSPFEISELFSWLEANAITYKIKQDAKKRTYIAVLFNLNFLIVDI